MPSLFELLHPYNVFHPKERLGPLEDGGYVMPVCVLQEASALFTYGVGNETRYEEEFSKRYQKPVFMYDFTVGTPYLSTIDPNVHFLQEGLGFGHQCRDVLEHYKESGITGKIFLKIDIEGGEFEYFLAANIAEIAKITTGMSLEVHWIDDPNNLHRFMEILNRLNEHYTLCHVHGNNWADQWTYEGKLVPKVLELSFINNDMVTNPIPDTAAYPIVGLDVPNNPKKEDYTLSFFTS